MIGSTIPLTAFPSSSASVSARLRSSLSRLVLISACALVAALIPSTSLLAAEASAAPEAKGVKEATKTASAETSSSDYPKVRIETTKGSIVVEVYPDKAPLSAANFLKLVEEGFYDGLVFHRVVANFVVQTGGYDAKLSYRAPPETVANESSNGLKNTRGTLAMARQSDPDSADAQFFINMSDSPHLDPVGDRAGYSVFGKVIAGMKVAERIELSDTSIQAGMAGVPVHPIEIISATRLP